MFEIIKTLKLTINLMNNMLDLTTNLAYIFKKNKSIFYRGKILLMSILREERSRLGHDYTYTVYFKTVVDNPYKIIHL